MSPSWSHEGHITKQTKLPFHFLRPHPINLLIKKYIRPMHNSYDQKGGRRVGDASEKGPNAPHRA